MYKDLGLKDLQWLICHKTQTSSCPRRLSASPFLLTTAPRTFFFFYRRVSVFQLKGLSFQLRPVMTNPCLTHLQKHASPYTSQVLL